MRFETPAELLARLKLGREEYCQRLLTTLLLHAPYPRWNTRSTLAPEGAAFLRDLHELSFGTGWPGGTPAFVDEFELPPPTDADRGGAPDYAVVWSDRLWLIELQTETGGHPETQVPGYLELAHHHHPEARIDLTYLTPPMQAPYQPGEDWARYAHVTWGALPDLLRAHWPAPTTPGQQEVLEGLLAAIDSLHLPPMEWRAAVGAFEVATQVEPVADDVTEMPTPPSIDDVMEMAAATAEDRRQRAVDFLPAGLEDLMALRAEVRERLAASPPGSPLRRVMPWIWQATAMGGPMTSAGRQVGMELRLSRYGRALYG